MQKEQGMLIASLDSEVFYDVVGLIGVVLYVASYGALQFGKLDGNSIQYCMYNGGAASLVLISLFHDFNLPSAIIQIVWISVSGYGIYKYWQKKRRIAVEKEELISSAQFSHTPANRRLRMRSRSDSNTGCSL